MLNKEASNNTENVEFIDAKLPDGFQFDTKNHDDIRDFFGEKVYPALEIVKQTQVKNILVNGGGKKPNIGGKDIVALGEIKETVSGIQYIEAGLQKTNHFGGKLEWVYIGSNYQIIEIQPEDIQTDEKTIDIIGEDRPIREIGKTTETPFGKLTEVAIEVSQHEVLRVLVDEKGKLFRVGKDLAYRIFGIEETPLGELITVGVHTNTTEDGTMRLYLDKDRDVVSIGNDTLTYVNASGTTYNDVTWKDLNGIQLLRVELTNNHGKGKQEVYINQYFDILKFNGEHIFGIESSHNGYLLTLTSVQYYQSTAELQTIMNSDNKHWITQSQFEDLISATKQTQEGVSSNVKEILR